VTNRLDQALTELAYTSQHFPVVQSLECLCLGFPRWPRSVSLWWSATSTGSPA